MFLHCQTSIPISWHTKSAVNGQEHASSTFGAGKRAAVKSIYHLWQVGVKSFDVIVTLDDNCENFVSTGVE